MSSHIAIVGGGVIGGAWAARFALNGRTVRVFDPAPDAQRRLDSVLADARRALPMLYERTLPSEGGVTLAASIEAAVEGADWVQESVPERLELKHATYRAIEPVIASDVPIASSTSGFRPSELQRGATHPGRILVAHPFNPVYLLPLVELAGSDPVPLARASALLHNIGMYPLQLQRENDAHIADRLLEAVWRESLWLVRDGYATTEEIDNAIRYGFGLRWAQMGLFETYRIAGGDGGMAHFVSQFGPCLEWPWTKLMDVPELTDELIARIASQSDAQSGRLDIGGLIRLRDDNLVSILRALKQQDSAAGSLITAHERTLPPLDMSADVTSALQSDNAALVTVRRCVPVDWTDYNGHMNESRYGQVFSDAADALLVTAGCDTDYVARGLSWFTAETTIRYLAETLAGESIIVTTEVTRSEGKKLGLAHVMRRAVDGVELARCDQFLLHVSLATRRSCNPHAAIAEQLAAFAASSEARS